MIAKIEKADVALQGNGKTVKITIDGNSRYKNVDSTISNALHDRPNIQISDKPMAGFRKLSLRTDNRGFVVKANTINEYAGEVYVCKRGLRDIGFKNDQYIYVKLGRKSRARFDY